MKSKLLLTALAVCLSYAGFSQTKGTNAINLGASAYTSKSSNYQSDNESKTATFSLGYSHFVSDIDKIGIDLSYGRSTTTVSSGYQLTELKNYSLGLNYQHYYPIIKKLYAYAGGQAFGSFGKGESNSSYNDYVAYKTERRIYGLGAYAGITWFVSKRFAFETHLLSATATYLKSEEFAPNGEPTIPTVKQTSFDLSTTGIINDLGFKIYILF